MATENLLPGILGILGQNSGQRSSAFLQLGIAGVVRQLTQAADERRVKRGDGRNGSGGAEVFTGPADDAPDRVQLDRQLRDIIGDLETYPPHVREQLEKQLAETAGPADAAPARRKRENVQAVVDSQLEDRPPPKPERQLSAGWLDKLQVGLDAAGIADPTPIADGANAVISLGRAAFDPERRREHLQNAGISAVSAAIPYLGDTAKLLKVGRAARKAEAASGVVHAARGATRETAGASVQPGGRVRSAMRWVGEGIASSWGAGADNGPPDQPPRFGSPSPTTGDDGNPRRQREDAAGIAAHDKWTEKLKDGALSIASFAGKVYLAVEGLQLLNRGVLALNKDLSQYSGTLAGSYAKGENADIRRDMRRANALDGPLSHLQEEQSKLQDSLEAFRTPIEGALIKLLAVGTKLTNLGVQAVQLMTPIQPILAILEWLAGTEKDEAPGGRQFLQDLSDGKFDGFGIDDLGKRFELLDKATRGQMGFTSQPSRPKKGNAPAPP